MFRVKHNVPDVYITESRDFQTLACLYDLVIQSNRFAIDSMQLTSDTARCNSRILPLIGSKVGLFKELKVNNYMYRKILSSFPYIMRYKGSIYAIELLANLFERLMNTSVHVEQSDSDNSTLTLVFEGTSPDTTLLDILLGYIKPTGVYINYAIRAYSDTQSDYTSTDKVSFTTTSVNSSDNTVGLVAETNYNTDESQQSSIAFTQISKLGRTVEGDN